MNTRSSQYIFIISIVCYFGIISFVSHIPGTQLPSIELRAGDKLAHILEFIPMGVLFSAVLRAKNGRMTMWKRIGVALLGIGILASLDEFHQSYVPGRYPSIFDIFADLTGAFLGLVGTEYFFKTRKKK